MKSLKDAGIHLISPEDLLNVQDSVIQPYISKVIENIQSRFRDTEELLTSLLIFDGRNFPTSSDDLQFYGRKELNFLL